MTDYQVIVLGLGGIGSAATYWASRRLGEEVLGIEQFSLGHPNGGSEDHSRIIRLSYHTPGYVRLAQSAYRSWSAVEQDSGEQLILRTGGLDLAPQHAAIGLDEFRASLSACDVPFDDLTASEVMTEWPQWHLPADATALYQAQTGIVMASKANTVHRDLARRNGARLLENQELVSVSEHGGEVIVTTTERRYSAESLIIAAGAWSNQVLGHLGVTFPLEVTLEQVVYLKPQSAEAFSPDRFPVWIWMTLPALYGFPILGEPAAKVAWDRCEIVTDPDSRSHVPRTDVIETIEEFTAAHLPDLNGGVHLAKTCLYTLTPDRDFVIDRVPGTDRVFTAIGAGHAYKFASLIGSILVDLAIDGTTSHDISPFTSDRAILRDPNPVRNYLI